jgi:hypothetical protein
VRILIVLEDYTSLECEGDEFEDPGEYASYVCKAYGDNRPMTFTLKNGNTLLLPPHAAARVNIIFGDN